MLQEYIFSGSLPENATTYVTRGADNLLYDGLKAGKFCYVLNSRQSGKSSLRVRTMRRLRNDGVACAAIDLSIDSVEDATSEQWYVGLIDTLIETFGLDFELEEWWVQNQLRSPLTRFRKFIEECLLVEIRESIVIFIDEIDSVLSLKFATDDFFAFIRACHNQRVDNPEYNRLTFCLLGVASPSNLIEDKKRTPFNIGRAITLKGFQIHEVEPLKKGLGAKYQDSQTTIEEILYWTGGQPFLTQKLCQFMVEESETTNPRTVEQVVKAKIIDNWESQDFPEHLRTIRDRIIRNEVRAGYLLELYQQIRTLKKVANNDSIEQSELMLSGLVTKQEQRLSVLNPIYYEVFNQNWINIELKKLRPYSEAFRAWIASNFTDESRLLRGKALADAEKWASDKNISYQDRQFLAASKEREIQEEIATKEIEAQIERERKDKEAAESRNFVLNEANRRAKKRIQRGSIILVVTLLLTTILAIKAALTSQEVIQNDKYLNTVKQLTQLAGQLREEGSDTEAKELFSQAGQSALIPNYNLKQQILYAGIAYANLRLRENILKIDKKSEDAKRKLQEAENYLGKLNSTSEDTSESLQFKILRLRTQGILEQQKEKPDINKAEKAYKDAFDTLNKLKLKGQDKIMPPSNKSIKIKLLSKENIEALHREYMNLMLGTDHNNKKNKIIESLEFQKVFDSLKLHFYDELENLLTNRKWQQADQKTWLIMLYIAKREEQEYLDYPNINNFSCKELQRIDKKWLNASKDKFGFSHQKDIWIEEITKEGVDIKNLNFENFNQINDKTTDKLLNAYRRLAARVGWYDESKSEYKRYNELTWSYDAPTLSNKGHLPFPAEDITFYILNLKDTYRFQRKISHNIKPILSRWALGISSLALRFQNCSI